MRTHSYCKDGTNWNYGLDGALVGLGWDGWLLAPAGTGVAEQERHHWLDGHCKQGTNWTDNLMGQWCDRGGTDKH